MGEQHSKQFELSMANDLVCIVWSWTICLWWNISEYSSCYWWGLKLLLTENNFSIQTTVLSPRWKKIWLVSLKVLIVALYIHVTCLIVLAIWLILSYDHFENSRWLITKTGCQNVVRATLHHVLNLPLQLSVNPTQYHPLMSNSHLPGNIDLWCLYLIDATIEAWFTLEEIVLESSWNRNALVLDWFYHLHTSGRIWKKTPRFSHVSRDFQSGILSGKFESENFWILRVLLCYQFSFDSENFSTLWSFVFVVEPKWLI